MAINKKEFINRMAANGNVTKRSCRKYLDLAFETFYGLLEEGEVIRFHSLFNAEVRMTPEKPARNISTGEKCIVPEHKYLKIKVSESLRNKLNG